MRQKKQLVRLTESDLHRIIKESVNNVLNEAHVIDKNFGMSRHPGSFESAIVEAWRVADSSNRETLEQAFPDYFPSEAMYGNEQDPFDFRDFPHYDAYNNHYTQWKERNHKA